MNRYGIFKCERNFALEKTLRFHFELFGIPRVLFLKVQSLKDLVKRKVGKEKERLERNLILWRPTKTTCQEDLEDEIMNLASRGRRIDPIKSFPPLL